MERSDTAGRQPGLDTGGREEEVAPDIDDREERQGFLLTWKESGWPHSNILRMVRTIERDGHVDENWRIKAHLQARPGDRVWVLKQGPGPKGIFGAGVILEPARRADAGNGKEAMMAPVRFFRFVDPKTTLLIDQDAVLELLEPAQVRAQSSGYPLRGEQPKLLEALVPTSAPSSLLPRSGESDEDPFDPASLEDGRQRTKRTILRRRGQKEFREALLAAYDGRCAITGCSIQDVLEAAHIYPYRGPETNRVVNGLLLRADLHTLFDCGLVAVDPDENTVLVAPALRSSEYAELHGQALRRPSSPNQAPSREALTLHRQECRF